MTGSRPDWGRRITSPTGAEAWAQTHDGDYRIVNAEDDTIGWMRGARKGSRRVWGIAVNYQDEFTGRYVDMGHALDGILFKRDQRR